MVVAWLNFESQSRGVHTLPRRDRTQDIAMHMEYHAPMVTGTGYPGVKPHYAVVFSLMLWPESRRPMTDKQMQELASLVDETGMSVTDIARLVRGIQTGTFAKVVEHEKYGWQIELHSTTHKPYSMSVNKARTAMMLEEDIKAFIENKTHKPKTVLRKAQ